MKHCIKCEGDFYAKELCKKHYRQALGESGGYKKEYAKRKLNPEYLKMRVESNKKYRRKKLQLRKYRLNLRKKVLSFYSPKLECVSCGFNDERALVIDHIENNGMIHKKTINALLKCMQIS